MMPRDGSQASLLAAISTSRGRVVPGGRARKSNKRVTKARAGTDQKALNGSECIHWTGEVTLLANAICCSVSNFMRRGAKAESFNHREAGEYGVHAGWSGSSLECVRVLERGLCEGQPRGFPMTPPLRARSGKQSIVTIRKPSTIISEKAVS